MAESPTVTVMCKLPHGLWAEMPGDSPGDPPVRVLFKGANDPSAQTAGGYGVTHGVDASFYKAWKERHGSQFTPVKQGLIFAQDKPDFALGQAKERAGLLSGFEKVDGEKAIAGIKAEAYEGMAKAS